MEKNALELFEHLSGRINCFMRSEANDLRLALPEPAFGMPLLGVAAGSDVLWQSFKSEDIIGPFHWTPQEAFSLAFPAEKQKAEELFVLVWILPQTEKSKADNREQRQYPSERWGRSRQYGEERVNRGLRNFVKNELQALGIQSVAPVMLPEWSYKESPRYTFASCWSERHAAYLAGLGTFGLSDGLITPVGKAMRAGSIIIRSALPVSPRPYSHYREYCLFFQDQSCKACAARCPVGSVNPEGRNKNLCHSYLWDACSPYIKEKWGLDTDCCGLCQTKVPCESKIPTARKNKKT